MPQSKRNVIEGEPFFYQYLSEKMVGNIMDHIQIGVAITDPNLEDNPIIYINRGFTNLTGYSPEEVLGKNSRLLQGYDTDVETIQFMREEIQQKQAFSVEIINYRKNGEPFWNGLNVYPVYNDVDELQFFVGFQRDITERKESERINQENLMFARKMQRQLLSKPIEDEKISIHGFYESCDQLGGDLYYWKKLDDHQYGVLLIDVMGHGVASSLVSMMIRTVSSEVINKETEPDQVLKTLNEYMHIFFGEMDEIVYFTAIYLKIDTDQKEIKYVNCGHPYGIIVLNSNECSFLNISNIPLGLIKDIALQSGVINYVTNSKILLYTDGLLQNKKMTMKQYLDEIKNHADEYLKAENEMFVNNLVFQQTETGSTCDDIAVVSIHLK